MSGRTDILPFQEANYKSERQVQTSILELLLAFIFDLEQPEDAILLIEMGVASIQLIELVTLPMITTVVGTCVHIPKPKNGKMPEVTR